MPASAGDATLVPPKTIQPESPWHRVLSKTDTPVAGSASKDQSGVPRWLPSMLAKPGTCDWKAAIGSYTLGPPPLSLQPDSATKVNPVICNLVPPAEITFGDTLG